MNYINYRIEPKKLDIVLFKKQIFIVDGFNKSNGTVLISNKNKVSYIANIESMTFLMGDKTINLNGRKPEISGDDYILMYYHKIDEEARLPIIRKFSDIVDYDWSDYIIYSWYPVDNNYVNRKNFNKLSECVINS